MTEAESRDRQETCLHFPQQSTAAEGEASEMLGRGRGMWKHAVYFACLLSNGYRGRARRIGGRKGTDFGNSETTAVTMGTPAKGVRDISLLHLLFCSAVSLPEMLPGQPCLHPQLQCQLPNPGLSQGTQPGSSLDWRQNQRLGKRGTRIKWEHLFTPSSVNLSTALFVFTLYCPPKSWG